VSDSTLTETPLAVDSTPVFDLVGPIFKLYRLLANEREAAAKREGDARRQFQEQLYAEYKRLALVAAEGFHLQRTVQSVEEALQAAGLDTELRRLRLMLARFEQALKHARAEVEVLDGCGLTEEIASSVEVIAFVEGGVSETRVKDTVEPRVKVDGQVILLGKVVTEVPRQDR